MKCNNLQEEIRPEPKSTWEKWQSVHAKEHVAGLLKYEINMENIRKNNKG